MLTKNKPVCYKYTLFQLKLKPVVRKETPVIEVRIHGRGGQGAVTCAELVAASAISEGKYAQAFPSFGPERRGAPVKAFIRVSDDTIRLRNEIEEPDVVMILDPTLAAVVNVVEGLKKDGIVIINSSKSIDEIKKLYKIPGRVASVDANTIAIETLGRPIANTTMIGALIKVTGIVKADSLNEVFEHRFRKIAEKNLTACQRAFNETKTEGI